MPSAFTVEPPPSATAVLAACAYSCEPLTASVLAALTAMFGTAGLVQVPELLPIAVRSTGLSLVYAIGTSIFGGTTQFVVTWLLAITHDPMAPAWYVMLISTVSMLAMWMLPESRNVDVNR